MTTYLRFDDLKRRGIVRNWACLRKWIARESFPPGRKLAANTRVWTETEVEAWLSSRPSAGTGEAA